MKYLLLSISVTSALLYGAPPHTTWTAYPGGSDSAQYSALKQVTRANVKQLEVTWTGEKGNYLSTRS